MNLRLLPATLALATLLAMSPPLLGEEAAAPDAPAAAAPDGAATAADAPAAESATEEPAEKTDSPAAGEDPPGPSHAEPAPEGSADDKPADPTKDPETPATEPAADPLGLSAPDPDNPGQATLDRAMDVKLGAEDLQDLNEVIDLLDGALEEGLNADNTDFAEQVLAATLMQRADALSQIVLRQPMPDPQVDPRGLQWLQVRNKALTDLLRVLAIEPKNFDAWVLIGRLQSLPRGDASEARRALTGAIRLAEASAKDPDAKTVAADVLAQAYALRGAAQKEDAGRMGDFTRAIELDPAKAEYLLLRAQAHRAAERADKCLEDIDRAIAIAPENPKVFELKALALSMQGKTEAAIEAFNRASELAPQLLSPYQYRGELYSQLGKIDDAIAQLDKALEVQPNNLASLLIRAQLLMADDQAERALADVETILEQRPGLVQAHLMKARALDKLERTDEAVAWLERLVAIDPSRAELQMQLAAFYVDKQMAPEAIETLTKVLEIAPDNDLALRLRGDMHLYAGQHSLAIADFEKALEIAPEDSGLLNNYAWTLATSPFESIRDGEKAIELATKACELTQYGAPHILSTLGAALAEAGRFEEAVKRSEEAVAKAAELGTTDTYDGQLDAEMNCYRSGQPWRELQKLSIAGPASETAEKLKDIKDLDSLPIGEAAEAAPDATPGADAPPATAEEAGEPSRSLDF